jgi:hypothetical protein
VYSSKLDNLNQPLVEDSQCRTPTPSLVLDWGQPKPKVFPTKEPLLWCNEKRCKSRNYRSSRVEHRNQAELDARSTQFNLEHLPEHYRLFHGCLKFPRAPLTVDPMRSPYVGWLEAKRSFASLVSDLRKQTGSTIEWRAKQHITWDWRTKTDDVHYDWIGYHDLSLSGQRVRRMFLDIWNQACMRQSTSCSAMVEFDREDIHHRCNYAYKYAYNGSREYDIFMRRHFLPATKLPVTWESTGFWIIPPSSQRIIFNGESKTVELRNKRAAWSGYIRSFAGDSIPEFTTGDYRQVVKWERALSDIIETLDCEPDLYHAN